MLYESIVDKTPIDKGWSGDQKYCVTVTGGNKYFLRISSVESLERKKWEYERMCEVAQLGIPMCLPVEFGTCDQGVYSMQSWIDGENVENIVTVMNEKNQYRYGLDAGRILLNIHAISPSIHVPNWETRFNAKIDRNLVKYENCGLTYGNGSEAFGRYIVQNRHLLKGRPQSYQHGDYHIGNMMIDQNGVLTIIDFDRSDVGDPWEEFNRIVWCAPIAPAFASGMVDGYFTNEIPMGFWRLLALYICSNTLGALPWAIPFGESQVGIIRKQAAQVLEWYDGMRCVVPSWYQNW